MAEKSVTWILRLTGGIICVIALMHIIFGPGSIPGSVPVNATMDSEDRFYATIFGGYGFAAIWASHAIDERREVIKFLMILLAVAGGARLVSWAMTGPPHPLFMFLTVVEFLLPLLVWLLLRAVPRKGTASS